MAIKLIHKIHDSIIRSISHVFCFKHLPLNVKQNFKWSHHLIVAERVLSAVVELLSFSVDKPSHVHDTIFSIIV